MRWYLVKSRGLMSKWLWVAEVQLQSETGLKLPLKNVLNFIAEHGCPRNLSSFIK